MTIQSGKASLTIISLDWDPRKASFEGEGYFRPTPAKAKTKLWPEQAEVDNQILNNVTFTISYTPPPSKKNYKKKMWLLIRRKRQTANIENYTEITQMLKLEIKMLKALS